MSCTTKPYEKITRSSADDIQALKRKLELKQAKVKELQVLSANHHHLKEEMAHQTQTNQALVKKSAHFQRKKANAFSLWASDCRFSVLYTSTNPAFSR